MFEPLSLGLSMRRREFIGLVGGVAVTLPLGARSQPANKLPKIGILGSDASGWHSWVAAFTERLGELGWTDKRTITIEYGWWEARPERAAEIAAEFVRQNVDVIVASGSAVPELKRATTSIPIVFAVASDPVGQGLVARLARPGGNITGLSLESTDIGSKRLELLRQVVPRLRHLAIMFDADYPAAMLENGATQAAAHTFDLEATPYGIRRVDDIAPAFDALKGHADALYVVDDSLTTANSGLITSSALAMRMPTIFANASHVRNDGLMSYGPNFENLFRRAAEMVDKILRGAKPSDIPVEQPTKFDLVINLKTAKALGLTIPQTLLATANEVIE
jgi:putative tryptophan/tyrosine transport system substrate-binding protein